MNPNYVLLIFLVFIILYTVITLKKQQKVMMESQNELNKIKIGDKVRTKLGIYGKVVEFYETTDGRIARLDISQNGTECLVDVAFGYISGVDEKKPVELDENHNIISIDGVPVEELEKVEEPATETTETETDDLSDLNSKKDE